MNDAIKTQISAFIDGELPQNEAELLLRRLCQDVELRHQAAQYLAMGRAMRGERTLAGMSKLRERVSAALDDKELQEEFADSKAAAPRFMRPLAGVAIAATVALVALVGLQQMSDVPDDVAEQAGNTVAGAVDGSYTVPDQDDGQLLDYYQRHNVIKPRLVTWPVIEELSDESELSEIPVDEDRVDEEAEDDAEVQDPAEAPTP